MSVNVRFEAVYSPQARSYLDQLAPDDYARVRDCITQLERDPYPPRSLATVLKVDSDIYPNAYWCGPWGIGFSVVDDAFVVIEAIGRYRP